MARRTGIGMLLSGLLGGRPSINPAAGADEDTLSGKMFNKQGQDVTAEADKYGTGVVRKPTFAMRLFNPDAAQQSDQANLEYNAAPIQAQQKDKIATAIAREHVRLALAYATKTDPDKVPQDQVDRVTAAVGNKITEMGLTPGQYNEMIAAQEELAGGGPQAIGRGRALKAEGSEQEERAFQDTSGPVKMGMARSKEAQAAGEQATTITSNEPARRRIQAGRFAGEETRLPLEEEALTQEMVNRVGRATNIDPQILQRDAESLRRELGRQPTEEDLRDFESRNRLFAETNNTPLQLGIENNRLRATNDSAPLVRQGVMNQIRQQAAASSQPPGELMANPTMYKPSADMSGNPATMYTPQSTMNPLFRPAFLKESMGMGFMPGASGSAATQGANRHVLPNGMVAMPSSAAPAPTQLVSPNQLGPDDPNSIYTAIAKGLLRSNLSGAK